MYYVSCTVLGTEDSLVSKTNSPCPHEAYSLGSFCNTSQLLFLPLEYMLSP